MLARPHPKRPEYRRNPRGAFRTAVLTIATVTGLIVLAAILLGKHQAPDSTVVVPITTPPPFGPPSIGEPPTGQPEPVYPAPQVDLNPPEPSGCTKCEPPTGQPETVTNPEQAVTPPPVHKPKPPKPHKPKPHTPRHKPWPHQCPGFDPWHL